MFGPMSNSDVHLGIMRGNGHLLRFAGYLYIQFCATLTVDASTSAAIKRDGIPPSCACGDFWRQPEE